LVHVQVACSFLRSGRPRNVCTMTVGRGIAAAVALILVTGLLWLLWLIRVPQAIITNIWPIHTYYTVRAEIELDGKAHVLEATGTCDWRWHVPLPMVRYDLGRLTFHGGFLTKVLDDGRAIVIFPGKHCVPRADKSDAPPPGSYWRWSRIFNQPGTFFYEIDLVTGDTRYPEGTRHDDFYLANDVLPAVLVLDDARDPKAIRYYPNPQEHMASDCASLRIRSYRVTDTSSGTITRRELEVPYLADLPSGGTSWEGLSARVTEFSVFDRVPWLLEEIERQPPLTRLFDVIEPRGGIRDWRRPAPDLSWWERFVHNPEDRWIVRDKASGRKVYWYEIDFHRPPAWEVSWDRAERSVSIPLEIIGKCHSVTTLYPMGRQIMKIALKAADARVQLHGPGRSSLLVSPATREVIDIDLYGVNFNPWQFADQP
jgi:hypothetical protein